MFGQAVTGHQVTKIDQQGVATDFFYDLAGRLTDVWQPTVADAEDANASTWPSWRYGYDANGNQTRQVDPKGRETTRDQGGRGL